MNVKTGEVLAMASYPDYDPSKFVGGISTKDWNEYNNNPNHPLVNKAMQVSYAPGSTFKMVTAIAALESNVVSIDERINDTGVYKLGNRTWNCWYYTDYHVGHGRLNVSDAIKHSCNYYFYEVGNRMGIDNLVKFAKYFGLGSKTGIELPSETKGVLASKEVKQARGETWVSGDTLNASIGQGDNEFSPLQMAKYISMVANGGNKIDVSIVKTIQNADGTGEDKESEDRAYKAVRRMISYAKEEIDRCNQADRKIKQQNTCFLNPVLTVEEGGVLGGKTERIDELYEEGVRLMTLTWNYENCIGSPNSANRKVMRKGLKPFGIETVRRMNELGMIVDVSHLSDGGFYDCVKYSEFPIVASHSNARSLCLHPRNLTDEMLRLLGNKGGVAGVNFYSAFLRKEGRAEISDIVKHILYMIDKAGEDAVALGTDFDGFSKEALPGEIRDVEDMWKLWERLERAGLTGRQIEKFASGNILRVMNDVLRKK